MSTAADLRDDTDRRRRAAFVWGVLLTAAIVVYELTTQPALAGLTLALKAGLRDFRTAFWLRLKDPSPGRGAAHFWLFVATGMGLSCLAAFLTFATLVAVGVLVRPRVVVMEFTRGAGLTVLASCAVAILAGTWAAARGLLGGHRLWASGGVHAERRAGHWPPRPRDTNTFPRLLAFIACGVIFVVVPTGYLVGTVLFPNVVLRPNQNGGGASAVVFTVVWWGCLLLLLTCWNRLQAVLPARTPADAWPDPPPPADAGDPYADRWADG